MLVTGISGFAGSRVAARLLADGHDVVGLSRRPERVGLDVPVVEGDAAEGSGLEAALEGVRVAYYLIHSLESGNLEGFSARDRRAATRFAEAARAAGVERIVYFGVPAPSDGEPTEHMRSRLEVEGILRDAVPDSVGVRSWLVVSGHSPSFRVTMEILRLPTVVLGPWRDNLVRPLDVRDAVEGLVAAATSPAAAGRSLDVMGPETLSLADLFRRVAAALGIAPDFVEMDEPAPDEAVAALARMVGGDPELIVPLTKGLAAGSVLPAGDGAEVLGLTLHPLEESIAFAVEELTQTTTGERT